MADLLLAWDAAAGAGDWAIAGPDLAADATLRSAVLVSLFTDRRAAADDALPDARDDDRRGWWGDLALDGDGADAVGSRLWLLARAKATPETARRAELYIREALAWMVADGVATALQVETEWQATVAGGPADRLGIRLTIIRGAAADRFDLTWSRTLSQ